MIVGGKVRRRTADVHARQDGLGREDAIGLQDRGERDGYSVGAAGIGTAVTRMIPGRAVAAPWTTVADGDVVHCALCAMERGSCMLYRQNDAEHGVLFRSWREEMK